MALNTGKDDLINKSTDCASSTGHEFLKDKKGFAIRHNKAL
jgi:hypothetical protein